MIKLTKKQQIWTHIIIISIFMILLIPLANNETVLNLIFPNSKIRSNSIRGVFLILFVFAIYSFISLRKTLKRMNSKRRYLLYVIVMVWLVSTIKVKIGEKIMALRQGIHAIEFEVYNSKINYQKDTLGMLHAEGHIAFRNFSSDTVAFKGILYGDNFLLQYNDSIADIFLNDQIKIPPKSTFTHPVKFDIKLEITTLKYSKYSGVINTIRRLAIYSDNKKKEFEL